MNPFIENSGFKNIIIAGDTPKDIESKLKDMDYNIIKTLRADFLYDSIAYHPDIVLHPLDRENIMVSKNLINEYSEILNSYNLNLISTEKVFELKYPDYTGLNIGRIGNYYIHPFKYTDEKAKEEFKLRNIKNIAVKQGYSKCSTLNIGKNILITSDRGIEKKLKQYRNLKVYYISPEGIKLEGMEYGFIGGTGIMLSEKDLILTGRTEEMKDYKRLCEILNKYEINVIYLSDKGIIDIGGFILF